ncbi:MAG: hypothetical protein PUG60_02220 [Lachnospiraceae bacterium]|nr:hypothetical protein [Lachnospiraceae bacterium]MDY4970717.1 hypothetical protein [Lachnospiraceae bacterium]
MERFLASSVPVYIMAVITGLGILGTWATGIYYRQMINQTENMMSARHSFLLQMRNRFENTYRVNNGIDNVPLFVDRQLSGNRFLGIHVQKAGKASQKAALLCLIFGGAVTMMQQIKGFSAHQVVTTLGVTLFCAVAGFGIYILSDMEYAQNQLQVLLEEYFTNTMAKRLANSREEERGLNKADRTERGRADGSRNENSRMDSGKTESRKKRTVSSQSFYSDSQDRHSEAESVGKNAADAEEESHFTEEDLQYLRQSLERIAAGRDRSLGNEKKHHFSAKDEKAIDDILREYFV